MSNSETENKEITSSPAEVTTTREWGCVKWFNHTRGYGFITGLQGDLAGNDVFVHHTSFTTKENVYRTLTPGEYVEFNVEKDNDGKDCAKDLTGILRNPLLCEVPKTHRSHKSNSSNTYKNDQSSN